ECRIATLTCRIERYDDPACTARVGTNADQFVTFKSIGVLAGSRFMPSRMSANGLIDTVENSARAADVEHDGVVFNVRGDRAIGTPGRNRRCRRDANRLVQEIRRRGNGRWTQSQADQTG